MQFVNNWRLPEEELLMIPSFEKEGGFQLDRLEKTLEYVTDFSIAIDGGAHVGSWSRVMIDHFNFVHSFEPTKSTFECLRLNLWAYERLNNIQLHNKALGNTQTEIDMTWNDKDKKRGNTGGRFIKKEIDKVGNNSVEMITIDSLQLPSLGFLKLDIEGCEFWALQGATKTIKKYKPIIFIEVKKGLAERFGIERSASIELLHSFGMHEVHRIKNDYIFSF